jgi:hypothetical protein
MKSTNLADIDADIVGANVRLLVTPASGTSTVIKFDRTTVDAKNKIKDNSFWGTSCPPFLLYK